MATLCRTTLNYAATPGSPMGSRAVEVDVHDGRAADLPDWTECGFHLVDHRATVEDWTDDEEIATVHYPEAEALARRLTGCDAALVSDHVKRRSGTEKGQREQDPVGLVHSDFAAGYDDIAQTAYRDVHGRGAATLARSGLSPADIEAAPRVLMLQLWRNVGPPRMDLPVCFCDARTITPAEVRPFPYTGYVAGGRSFDALAVMAPEGRSAHAWYSFPDMRPDEVVAFRTYDTELVRAGRTYFTPHSAFRDPTADARRFSVELRVMCLFT